MDKAKHTPAPTHYYWNDCAMGNGPNGFIQEEPERDEALEAQSPNWHYIGAGDCLDEALEHCRQTRRAALLDNERLQAAIERDYV